MRGLTFCAYKRLGRCLLLFVREKKCLGWNSLNAPKLEKGMCSLFYDFYFKNPTDFNYTHAFPGKETFFLQIQNLLLYFATGGGVGYKVQQVIRSNKSNFPESGWL